MSIPVGGKILAFRMGLWQNEGGMNEEAPA